MWFFYTFLSVVFSASLTLLTRHYYNRNPRIDSSTYPLAIYFVGFLLSLFSYIITGVHLNDFFFLGNYHILIILFLYWIFYTIFPYAFYFASSKVPASITQIFFSLNGLFALIISLFLDISHPQPLTLVGSFLVILGVIFANIQNTGSQKKLIPIMLLLLSAFIYALANITEQYLLVNYHINLLLFSTIAYLMPIISLIILSPHLFKPSLRSLIYKPNRPLTLGGGILSFLIYIFLLLAFSTKGQVWAINIILNLEIPLVIIGGVFILKEKSHPLIKFIAASIIAVGVYLISG